MANRIFRFSVYVLLQSLIGSNVLADSYLHCKYKQQQLNDEIYQRFVEGCDRVYFSCVDFRMSEHGETRDDAGDNCIYPIKADAKFNGPCPDLLYELESAKYDGFDSVIARVNLREWFKTDGDRGYIEFYKQADSMKSIRSLLEEEPNNLRAVSYEHFHRYRFEDEEDIVALVKSAIKMYELDPNCSSVWKFNPHELVNLISDLLKDRKTENTNATDIPDGEFEEILTLAFYSMRKAYEHVYRSSENIRKLDYAKKLIEHPFMFLDEEYSKALGNILKIDPVKYSDDWRRTIVADLTDLYIENSGLDWKHSMGMICNDYAFEIGLANQCLDLISSRVAYFQTIQKPFPDWLLEAAVLLAMTASRECGPYSQKDNVDFHYLHCTFCHQTLYCLDDEKNDLRSKIIEIFSEKTKLEHPFEYYLIRSYGELAESTLSHYQKALSINDVALLHASLLAKRLKYEGFPDTALGVLDAALSRMNLLNVSAVLTDKRDYLGSETCNSSFRMESETLDLSGYQTEIRKMREVLKEGRYYAFFESGRCSLRWGN